MLQYPAFNDVQDDLKSLFQMLTGKTEANIREAARAGWAVQGFLQSYVLPLDQEPATKVKIAKAAHKKLTNQQAVAALGVLCGQRNAKKDLAAQGILDGVVGGALRDQLFKLLLPVLSGWIQRWVNGGGLEDLIGGIIGKKQTKAAGAKTVKAKVTKPKAAKA